MKAFFASLRNLFRKEKQQLIEPLLHSNVERLFEEWSSGFNLSTPSSQTAEVAGRYSVKGHNPGTADQEYFGTLTIEPKGSLVRAYWEIGFARQPQHGWGFVKNNLLALDFYYTEDSERYYGQVIYRIEGDRLTGFWRENHVGEVSIEEASLLNRMR